MQLLGAVGGFFAGIISGVLIAFLAYQVWISRLGGFDREGSVAMAVFFFYGPIIGVVLGSGLAILCWKLLSPT